MPDTARIPAPQLRQMAISELSDWLRTQTNRNKLPFQERAIDTYTETARVLAAGPAEAELVLAVAMMSP